MGRIGIGASWGGVSGWVCVVVGTYMANMLDMLRSRIRRLARWRGIWESQVEKFGVSAILGY